jgi:predicted tellurium resistance membrane protein TerC
MSWITDPEIWAALITLAGLEIVLGIDNIIFISIMVGRLPEQQRERARIIGLAGACVTRILLLLSLAFLARLTAPLFTVLGQEISGRDLVLIIGGLFLLAKATYELREQVEGGGQQTADEAIGRAIAGFASVVVQIMIIDIVFSLDSVITAVGMTQNIPVMVAAIIIAVGVMMFFAGPVGRFVERNPTIKVLALSFLIMIGMALVGEGFDAHVPKGYIYFAMAFSLGIEMLNMRVRRKMDSRAK